MKDPNVGAEMKITKKGNEARSLPHNTLRIKRHVEASRWNYDEFISKNSSWVQPTQPNKKGNWCKLNVVGVANL